MASNIMELIPGLPNDIALECLIRAPVDHFSKVASVCKDWKRQIEQAVFWQRRKMFALASTIIVMVQEKVDTVKRCQVYRLTVCDPVRNSWNELPPIPGFLNGLPMFCKVVGVGLDVMVIGGCEPTTWKVLGSVYIFNFVTSTWRRGDDMPGGSRLFFGCASDSDRTVLVAGGHNRDKNALRSALSYDVKKNEWTRLPDMTNQRDECQCLFNQGKFHVIGGYQTDRQGQFEKSAEIFEVASWKWCQQEVFLPFSNFSRACYNGGKERLYIYQDTEVIALENDSWKVVTQLPIEFSNVSCLAAWENKLLAIGSGILGAAYVLDLDDNSWTKLQVSDKYNGHVQGACCLII